MVRESCMPSKEIWEEFFDPQKIVQTLITPTNSPLSIVELGCGYGTFTLSASLVPSSKIIAYDINEEHLYYLQREIERKSLSNIQLIKHDFVKKGISQKNDSIDHIMIYNLLHLEDPLSLLQEVNRVLKDQGDISVIHWRSDITTPRGPDLSIRPTQKQCCKWIEKSGFTNVQNKDISNFAPYHYAITATKGKK